MTSKPARQWWRDAVIYQVYPRSFSDSSGDGIGDLNGVTERLSHIAGIGADAVWLSPFYRSPQRDGGYDVSDFCDVDQVFGTLGDAQRLIAEAHRLGLRIIVDIVPNHTSNEHPWFVDALAAGPGSPERERFIFRQGKGASGDLPPNNWTSVFGGPAWTRVVEADGSPGDWYLHLFDSSQPDLDWTNPWVADRFDEILRFWLDLSVDGFRIDVANGLAKAQGLPDLSPAQLGEGGEAAGEDHPFWGRDDVHPIWRRWRAVVDAYPGERALVGEAWVMPLTRMAKWVREDELHQAFNFGYLLTRWDAAALRTIIQDSLDAFGGVGAPSTWVLSNHDTVRHSTRLALRGPLAHGVGIGQDSQERPEPERAAAIGRAASLLMLALPGSAYVYQGEELGLPEAIDLPDAARQDPTWFRTGPGVYGRDGARVPLPWQADAPAFGFSPTGAAWLPQPAAWANLAADVQVGDPGSTLEMYKQAIRLRKERGLGFADLAWNDGPAGVVDASIGGVRVVTNTTDAPVPMPGGRVLIASGPVTAVLPANTTVWLEA